MKNLQINRKLSNKNKEKYWNKNETEIKQNHKFAKNIPYV